MSSVCGRTRLLVSSVLILFVILFSGYLYMDALRAVSSSPDRPATRGWHDSLSKRQTGSKYPYIYPRGRMSPARLQNLRSNTKQRVRPARYTHYEVKRKSHFPEQPAHSRFSNHDLVRNGRLAEPGRELDNVAEYDSRANNRFRFSVDDETGENSYDQDSVDGDLYMDKQKRKPVLRQKEKVNVRLAGDVYIKHHQAAEHPILQDTNIADRDKFEKIRNVTKIKSNDREPVPDFNLDRIRSQTEQVKVDKTLYRDKWIVVTSILKPTPDVIFLSNIPGWQVLVVGDTKTPSNWSHPNCIFLNVADQESLGLSLAEHLPYRSYARKNLGYLFAVAHGAKVIYETDDDNRPLDLLKSFTLSSTMPGLMFAGEKLFNPYHHFGQSTLWPRGYPLGAVGSPQQNLYRLSSKWTTPAIQQGVVNGDPDMDAIFRLTRKQTTSRLTVKFDPAAPPAILPEGVYCPFNSQNTLFKYEALWAMLLPTTTTFRMCDIWRGYWAQRLLWEIGARLAFYPPNAYQQRNAHSYMDDAEDERDMYYQTDQLLEFLTKWSCPQEYSFFQCVHLLSADMARENFWKEKDIEITRLWLEDLVKVGYLEPKRMRMPTQRTNDNAAYRVKDNYRHEVITAISNNSGALELAERRLSTLKNGTHVYFAASQQIPPSIYAKSSSILSPTLHYAGDIASICSNLINITLKASSMISTASTHFDDVLLIVVFNWPHYSNVRYLEAIYRHIFPNIAYCGGNADKFLAETKDLDNDLTFINAPVLIGVYGYTCFIAGAQMGYNVSGYMVVGDDVLVNMWNFHGFDKDRIWSNYAVHIFNVNNGTNWAWWGFKVGEQAYNNSMVAIKKQKEQKQQQQSQLDQQQNTDLPHMKNSAFIKNASSFLSTLHNNTGGAANCPHAVNDVYYIPAHLAPSAVHYLSLFARSGLMLELAISMTIYGLSPRDDIQFFSGDNLWLAERLDPWRKFNLRSFFLHPVKFSNASNLEPLCFNYLTAMLDRMYKGTADSSNNPLNAARRAYLERLQRNYREKQDMQVTWLQHEQLAMKKQKEERLQVAQKPNDDDGFQKKPIGKPNQRQSYQHVHQQQSKENRPQPLKDEKYPVETDDLLNSQSFRHNNHHHQHHRQQRLQQAHGLQTNSQLAQNKPQHENHTQNHRTHKDYKQRTLPQRQRELQQENRTPTELEENENKPNIGLPLRPLEKDKHTPFENAAAEEGDEQEKVAAKEEEETQPFPAVAPPQSHNEQVKDARKEEQKIKLHRVSNYRDVRDEHKR